MKKASAIMCAILILFVTGCGAKLKEGEVYEKTYSPAHTAVVCFPNYFYSGGTPQIILIPYNVHYDESWCIKIRAYDKDTETWDKADYYVDEETYSEYEVGDIFKCEDVSYSEEPEYTKEKQK